MGKLSHAQCLYINMATATAFYLWARYMHPDTEILNNIIVPIVVLALILSNTLHLFKDVKQTERMEKEEKELEIKTEEYKEKLKPLLSFNSESKEVKALVAQTYFHLNSQNFKAMDEILEAYATPIEYIQDMEVMDAEIASKFKQSIEVSIVETYLKNYKEDK